MRVDASVAPVRVLGVKAQHQSTELRWREWPSGFGVVLVGSNTGRPEPDGEERESRRRDYHRTPTAAIGRRHRSERTDDMAGHRTDNQPCDLHRRVLGTLRPVTVPTTNALTFSDAFPAPSGVAFADSGDGVAG